MRIRRVAWLCGFVMLVCALPTVALDDIVIADFEEGQGVPKDWQHEGEAFRSPIRRGHHGQAKVIGCRGESLLSSLSWEGDDTATGRAFSPEFEIQRKYITFLIAGGNYPGRTCVNLLVDGTPVRSVAGSNSLRLAPVAFDVAELAGKTARIAVIDEEQRPWGHISVDHVVQTDRPGTDRIIREGGSGFLCVVQTAEGRAEGRVQLREGALRIDGKAIPLEEIQFVVVPPRSPQKPQPHALRLVGGEVWRTTIESFADGELTVVGGLCGQHEVDLERVEALDFQPDAEFATDAKPGVLYRTEGRPLPGKLLWLNEKEIAVDCLLGILPLPRTGLVRYVFPERKAESEPHLDKLGLRDGSILHGNLQLDGDVFVLSHPTLKRIEVPWPEVRFLVRGASGIRWLHDLPVTKSQRLGPLGPSLGPHVVELGSFGNSYLSSLRLQPQTLIQYRLPAGDLRREFHAVLVPMEGCRADATVRIGISGKTLLEKKISATDSPASVSIPLPAADELILRVDFAEGLTYPCGVDLRDAHVNVLDAKREASKR